MLGTFLQWGEEQTALATAPGRVSAACKHFPLRPLSCGLNADTNLLPKARSLPSIRIYHHSAQDRLHGALGKAAAGSDPALSQ